MKEIFTNIFGYSAAAVGMALMLPQIYKMYKTKKVTDISWGTLILYFLNSVLWLAYGVLDSSIPLVTANTFGIVVSVVLIVFKVKFS
ncbi:MAG TPA: SemiSWEET family transporter [Candidatus Paceibacterota bacterium]